MNYARNTWSEELASWRIVVQLNLLRNVHTVLDIMAQEMENPSSSLDVEDLSDDDSIISPTVEVTSPRLPRPPLNFTEKHRILKLELLPLRQVQADLEQLLGASSQEEKSSPFSTTVLGTGSAPLTPSKSRGNSQELFVRSNNGWKATLRPGRRSTDTRPEYGFVRKNREVAARETAEIIAGSAEGMKTLWDDDVVQEMLKRRKVKLDTAPGL